MKERHSIRYIVRGIWRVIRETFEIWNTNHAPRWAAAIAYYAAFAIAPLSVIMIGMAGAIFGEDAVRGEIVTLLEQYIGADIAHTIQDMVLAASQERAGGLATLISLGLLFFGAAGLFGALQDALNTIWRVRPGASAGFRGILRSRFFQFVMVVSIGGLLLIFLLIGSFTNTIIHFFGDFLPDSVPILLRIADILLSLTIGTLLFAMLYKLLPDAHIEWQDVFIGAAVTSCLFYFGELLLSIYLSTNAVGSYFGAAGSFVVILVWLYYSAQILLVGAAFTRVFARYRGKNIRARYADPTEL